LGGGDKAVGFPQPEFFFGGGGTCGEPANKKSRMTWQTDETNAFLSKKVNASKVINPMVLLTERSTEYIVKSGID